MPWRLIRISLILIVIGILPPILSLIHLTPLPPARVLELLFVPPTIGQWVVQYVGYQSILVTGVALLLLAAILAARKFRQQASDKGVISTSDVLLGEAEAIHGEKAGEDIRQHAARFFATSEQLGRKHGRAGVRDVSPQVFRWLSEVEPRGRTALCFSGGGIRSASFALGVLQAFAMHPRVPTGEKASPERSLLAQFNYLSTVSGGGYIGGWFSAWVHRASYSTVWENLVRLAGRDKDPGEQAAPLKWLRIHSNFLTPTLGLSGDTMAGVAIVLRNLMLNWLVLLPALCAALISMKLIALWGFRQWDSDWTWKWWVPFVVWLALLLSALSFTLGNRPSRTHGETSRANQVNQEDRADEATFKVWGLLPSVVAAVGFTLFLVISILHVGDYRTELLNKYPALVDVIGPSSPLTQPSRYGFGVAALLGAFIYALSYAISWIRSWPSALGRAWAWVRALTQSGIPKPPRRPSGNFWRWTLSGAVYGTLVMAITYLFLTNDVRIERLIFLDYLGDAKTADVNSSPRRLIALLYLGVPLMLLAQLLAEMIFVGLTSEEAYSDEDREWLGRAAGLCLLAGAGWLVVMHLAYIGTDITIRAGAFLIKHPWQSLTFIGLLYAVGAVAAAVARSSRTPAQWNPQLDAKTKTANTTLSIVAVVLLVALIIGVSALIDYLVLGDSIAECVHDKCDHAWINFWLALAAVVVIGLIASRRININRFSLHALYRNRLIRMFLGASNVDRRANPFTDFDQDDNLPMWKLWPPPNGKRQDDGQAPVGKEHWRPDGQAPFGKEGWRPFHIVNIALNVSSSHEHLEWQERKAASFTVSPLHCGSAVTGFRSSKVYGGYNEEDADHSGISLGTAMAISGAAASPNQGYISSAPLAFLMALFNVRLGWWLGNPGKTGEVTHKYDGPRNALVPFFSEMLGMTSDANKYVYLSDGGHFENLALYEMVRRRCRFIVVSDGGCDPNFEFEDLGNAVRKIEIDLGVPIQFYGLDRLKARHTVDRFDALLGGPSPPGKHGNSEPPPYHAIGIIDYAAADGADVENNGVILYIKPGYHGRESSAGVRSYALANPAFPHESTGDQFFGESQMESYRALGFEIMSKLLRQALKDLHDKTDPSLQDVLNALRQHSESSAGDARDAPKPGLAVAG